MSFEISEVMNKEGALANWASHVRYGAELSQDEREFSEAADAWARNLGKTGKDPNGELSALIAKALTEDVVTPPSELIGLLFDEGGNVGEFDDTYGVFDPKNTIQAHEAILEGNVDRSFIEHRMIKPEWVNLAAETDISMLDLRRGGYRTVATLVNYIQEAFEWKRIATILDKVDTLIVAGNDNYIAEATANPTEATADKLALYLQDMTDGTMPTAFMLNKYRQAMSKLAQAQKWPTEAERGIYNHDGFLVNYAGMDLVGFSGQKKLADGSLLVPDKRVFGVAGKIGAAMTRGETRVLQHEDINAERVHVKVNGYTFGYMINDTKKIAKIVMAQ